MSEEKAKIRWLIPVALASITVAVTAAALLSKQGAAKVLPVYSQVADFQLTNQFGQSVTLQDLRGHVWVADIIFTRCAGPCPKMTRAMRDLQTAIAPGGGTRLVTLTTDPVFDAPAVMKAYSERFGADSNRWLFLTGTQQQIAQLASGSLKLTAIEKGAVEQQDPSDLFIHSTIFVVVDKQARLRGVYETVGDDIDPERVKAEILSAVTQLERES